jgi:hypothetical protein
VAHLIDDQPVAFAQLYAALKQVKPSKHGREKVVEVMGDAAGQLADGIHFLRLQELVFELSAFADIEEGARELNWLAAPAAEQDRLIV